MPRLSDLLPDKLKKQLIAETKKMPPPEPPQRPPEGPRDHPRDHQVNRRPVKKTYGPTVPVPDFVAVDVETTGLDFQSDRIIEIGAVKFIGGKPAGEFSFLVNPGITIPELITDLTGITNADIAPAPKFSTLAANFLAFVGDLPVAGHQVTFDLTFINKELERAGLHAIGEQSLDTVLLSKIVLESGMRFSLKSVSNSLEVTLDKAHRALYDAKATGEIAVLLVPKIAELPMRVRQTMAAAAPGSFLKSLIFKSLGDSRPRVIVRQRSEAPPAPKLTAPETFREIAVERVKSLLSPGGGLDSLLPSFVRRDSQVAMAVEVAGALNTQSFLAAEAGTGTGKSLAYLVPAALWALENGTRVVVATHTRNLQDQLTAKDLPLVNKLIGGKLRYSVLKGRSNYICLNRFERLLRGESGNLSVRERFAILPLIPWVENTETGDIEEQNQFNPKWFQKVWDLIAAEGRGCEGRRCPFYGACFLQQARRKSMSSHIVVINHALFFAEMGSANSFLGNVDSIVFDEAHHLESGGHNYLRVELDTSRVSLFIEELNNLVHNLSKVKVGFGIAEAGKDLKSQLKRVRKYSQSFLDTVSIWAKSKVPEMSAGGEYQVTVHAGDFASNVEAPAFNNSLEMLRDLLYQLKQELSAGSGPDYDLLKEDAITCQERTSQFIADLGYLVSAQTDDHAFWAEGNFIKGWTKLCGVPLDVAGLLSTFWGGFRGAVVFTSATLSVARSADYFVNSVGLQNHQARTTASVFPSPFGRTQAIMGAIRNAPDPDSREFPSYIASVIAELRTGLKKNILVLFTSNSMLSETYGYLRANPAVSRRSILAQNINGARHVLLEQFKKEREMILLGTDSFWEGIDVPGEECEIVLITRLPFPVPTHPLTLAISEKAARIHGESFMSYAVPEAVIRFRQGCGRLIRSATDRGALIVLDNRIITKNYGRRFIRSLDGDFQTFEDRTAMLDRVKGFFAGRPEDQAASTITYVPFDEV